MMMMTKKMVNQAPSGTGVDQYCTVVEATVISSGNTTAH
jgi:hypothetical protein